MIKEKTTERGHGEGLRAVQERVTWAKRLAAAGKSARAGCFAASDNRLFRILPTATVRGGLQQLTVCLRRRVS